MLRLLWNEQAQAPLFVTPEPSLATVAKILGTQAVVSQAVRSGGEKRSWRWEAPDETSLATSSSSGGRQPRTSIMRRRETDEKTSLLLSFVMIDRLTQHPSATPWYS
eukprot:scaffold391_cov223-Pinguiococcus_pyrenoidosus.AAC.6